MRREYFNVCPGIVMNIALARKLVAERKPNTVLLSIAPFVHMVKKGEAGVNRKHVIHGWRRREPVIMMVIAGHYVLIDGWHRVMRAHRNGQSRILAVVLNSAEAIKCAEDSTRRRNRERP